ncbi:MAG: hypothetical protein LBT00_01560 [Spirochaetaceae bacterium]|nr:hypothetical protein [Spirochaetaceae bacterium]
MEFAISGLRPPQTPSPALTSGSLAMTRGSKRVRHCEEAADCRRRAIQTGEARWIAPLAMTGAVSGTRDKRQEVVNKGEV